MFDKTAKLARLNELRAAKELAPLKKWKASNADLDAKIAVMEREAGETDSNGFPLTYADDLTAVGTAAVDPPAVEPAKEPDADPEDTPLVEPTVEPAPEPEKTEDPLPDAALRACLLIYDIPSKAEVLNPSHQLRRIGFRANLSCWVIPEGSIPYSLINKLRTEHDAKVDVIRFDAAEGPRLVKMAIDAVERDVAEQVERTTKSLAGLETKYFTGNELPENVSAREAALKQYERRAKWVTKELNRLMDDVKDAVKCFAVDPARLNLNGAVAAHNAMQVGFAAKANAYAAATEALRKLKTTDATALANAATKDEVPAGIVADALRDAAELTSGDEANDLRTEAAKLDAAFAVESPTADSNGEFSLV